ncbi:MAG TPA: hypothetical protein VK567_24625, partial [Bradyrhizobium sp.]|nr:hypothetical protein [Bradyrhizobium sp.]
NNVALGFTSDGVYCTPTAPSAANPVGCTGNIELTTAWSIGLAYEHYWTSSLASMVFGNYGEHKYNSNVVNGGWMCGATGSGIPASTGGATGSNNQFGTGGVPGGINVQGRCDPSFNLKTIGAQIDWYPGGGLRLAAEVGYMLIGTAFSGQQVELYRPFATALGVLGARPSGIYTAKDQGIVSFAFRAQKGFGGVGE